MPKPLIYDFTPFYPASPTAGNESKEEKTAFQRIQENCTSSLSADPKKTDFHTVGADLVRADLIVNGEKMWTRQDSRIFLRGSPSSESDSLTFLKTQKNADGDDLKALELFLKNEIISEQNLIEKINFDCLHQGMMAGLVIPPQDKMMGIFSDDSDVNKIRGLAYRSNDNAVYRREEKENEVVFSYERSVPFIGTSPGYWYGVDPASGARVQYPDSENAQRMMDRGEVLPLVSFTIKSDIRVSRDPVTQAVDVKKSARLSCECIDEKLGINDLLRGKLTKDGRDVDYARRAAKETRSPEFDKNAHSHQFFSAKRKQEEKKDEKIENSLGTKRSRGS